MPNINRRNLIKTIPAIAVGTALPTATEAKPTLSPDHRISAALEELQDALQEKYPDYPVEVRRTDLKIIDQSYGEMRDYGMTFLVYAMNNERFRLGRDVYWSFK